MNKIYLSGKISGLRICEAIKNFESAENQLKKYATIVNPMRLRHDHDKSWQSYMKEDIKALMNCDAIAMLPNFDFEIEFVKKQIEQLKDVISNGNFVGYSEALANRKERLILVEKTLKQLENSNEVGQLTLF